MLYHKQLGFPKTLELPEKEILVPQYSLHAKRSANDDRYGFIKLPEVLKIEKHNIIEVETEDNITPTKIMLRVQYTNTLDLCLVYNVQDTLVRTVWLNKSTDRHASLDKSKYTRY